MQKISGFTVLASVLAFGALFGLIGAIIGVPIAAALQPLTSGCFVWTRVVFAVCVATTGRRLERVILAEGHSPY